MLLFDVGGVEHVVDAFPEIDLAQHFFVLDIEKLLVFVFAFGVALLTVVHIEPLQTPPSLSSDGALALAALCLVIYLLGLPNHLPLLMNFPPHLFNFESHIFKN